MRIYKIKRESWNAPTLAQTRLSQKPPKESRPSEPNLAQARSLQRRWVCLRPTHPGEPNHAQARSHLAQA